MAAAHHAAPRQPHQYSIPPPPPPAGLMNDALRLPSIKDLQFSFERPRTEGQQHHSTNGVQNASEISVSASQERSRPHSQSWGRSAQHSSAAHPQQQHTPPLSGLEPKSGEYSTRHNGGGGYLTPGLPLSAQTTPLPGSVSVGPAIRNDDLHHKRPRPSPIVPPRDSRPSHVVYQPQYQSYQPTMPPPSPYHQTSPVLAPPSMHHTPVPLSPHANLHQQPGAPPTHPAYSYQPQPQQPYMPRSSSHHVAPPHTYNNPPPHQVQQPPPPPPPPPPASQPPPSIPYPSPSPSASQEQPPHWEHSHSQPVPSAQHHQAQHAPPPSATAPAPSSLTNVHYISYSHPPPPPPLQQQPPSQLHPAYSQSSSLSRAIPPVVTTPIVPTPEVEIRTPYPVNSKPSSRETTMSEIVKLCSILYDFASRYSTLSSALPHVQPSLTEVTEMARRANDVVRLLDVLRRMDNPDAGGRIKEDNAPGPMPITPDDHRAPKRPWEDMGEDDQLSGDDSGMFQDTPGTGAPEQTTAEQDMELIRSKRATTTAGAAAAAGQPKSKYRKRSRATPPGKCHSCNIRETPEWRRGPDGARTLCNACGLHYAKLMRKQSKQNANAPNGEGLPKIDLDTLKAATKAAEAEKNGGSHAMSKSDDDESAPHTGQFQVSVLSPAEAQAQGQQPSLSSSSSSDPSRLPAHHQTILPPPTPPTTTAGPMHPPPPPWAANHSRSYPPSDQFQGQSFIRTNR
ncbi:hypothetical protein D9757_002511 [Collybiopsis confluens]|uniref:GATA-type domain-containing protein n=1 Tax=Collybiopsis confluens TaxID=2823264 RepID=A0A8H5HY44_9AGAR|nr:hypothetical protein D9757_002511 [Collybiopsis confluens]